MNCKPGMVVMVKKSKAGNEGRVGAVLRWVEAMQVPYSSGASTNRHAGWLVEGRFRATDRISEEPYGVFPDEWLIPLRDNDGEDQTLTWAGKPSDIKTPEAA